MCSNSAAEQTGSAHSPRVINVWGELASQSLMRNQEIGGCRAHRCFLKVDVASSRWIFQVFVFLGEGYCEVIGAQAMENRRQWS